MMITSRTGTIPRTGFQVFPLYRELYRQRRPPKWWRPLPTRSPLSPVLTTPSVPGDLTAAAEFVLGVFYPFYGSALGSCGPKVRISSVFFSWLLGLLGFFWRWNCRWFETVSAQ